MSPRAKDIKERKKQMGPDQNKKFLHGQKKSIKMKRETTIWENIFAYIYKELTLLHSKKTSNTIKKMGKGLEQTLLQRGYTEGP